MAAAEAGAHAGLALHQLDSPCEVWHPENQMIHPLLPDASSRAAASADAAGICSATEGHEPLLIVDNLDVDDGGRLARAPDTSDGGQSLADRRPQVVGAEIHGRHAAANPHADGEIAHNVDERSDRPAVELAGAGAPLELGPHRHLDRDLLPLVIERDDLQAEPADERRAIEDRLHRGSVERRLGGVTHGSTRTLPNTMRSSSNLNASWASASATSRTPTRLTL